MSPRTRNPRSRCFRRRDRSQTCGQRAAGDRREAHARSGRLVSSRPRSPPRDRIDEEVVKRRNEVPVAESRARDRHDDERLDLAGGDQRVRHLVEPERLDERWPAIECRLTIVHVEHRVPPADPRVSRRQVHEAGPPGEEPARTDRDDLAGPRIEAGADREVAGLLGAAGERAQQEQQREDSPEPSRRKPPSRRHAQSITTNSGTAGISPFAAPRSNSSSSAARPGWPMSTVSSLTYMPTNFFPRSRSRPRPKVSA